MGSPRRLWRIFLILFPLMCSRAVSSSPLSSHGVILCNKTCACFENEQYHAHLHGHMWLFANPWTVTHQAPLFMGFSRCEYWSRLPFASPRIFLTQALNLCFLHLLHWQAESLHLCHLLLILRNIPALVHLWIYQATNSVQTCCLLSSQFC